MSLIKSNTRTRTASARTEREPTPYDNLWLNLGVHTEAPTEDNKNATKFVRLPRGVAVSDLEPKKVYANMSDEFASEVTLTNQIINIIRDKGLSLKPGESADIALEVQIYARQEDIEAAPVADTDALAAQLFGTNKVDAEVETSEEAF